MKFVYKIFIIFFIKSLLFLPQQAPHFNTLTSRQPYKYLSHYIKDKDVIKANELAVEMSKKNNYCTSASTQQTSKPHLLPDTLTPSTYSSNEIEHKITIWIPYPESTVLIHSPDR